MQKVNTKKKIILAIIGLLILVIIALLIGKFTFSYLGADIGEDVKNEGEITASGDTIIFSKGNNLSLSATTDNFNATSGNLTDTTNPSVRLIASSKTNEASATYYAGIKISKNTFTYSSGTTAELILTVRDETGALVTTSSDDLDYVTVNGISGFDITGKIGAFNISSKHPINTNSSTSGTTHTWTFTLTFVNLETDQSINENAILDMDAILQKDEIVMPTFADLCREDNSNTFACKIATIYTTDGENGLYYHDGVGTYTNADQEAGDNSYRYSGANPNNYVCFGSDADTCPDEYLYRIIGVFDENHDYEYNVKLIKADYTTSVMLGTDGRDYNGNYPSITSHYIGNMDTSTIAIYRWNYDTSVSSLGSNNWTTSELNKINLNSNYLNYLGILWNNMIEDSIWHLGGMLSYNNTTKNFYVGERNNNGYSNNPTKYTAKIGLMYTSDYGYAAYPHAWVTNLSSYDSTIIKENNWLYLGLNEWGITSNSSYNFHVFSWGATSSLNSSAASIECSIRPVFYLKSNISYASGNGTKASPFRVGV